MATEMFLNLDPTTYVKGGLIDDVDVEIISAEFELFDYGGNSAAVPALKLNMRNLADSTDEVQHYSCGALKDFEPSDDGMFMKPTGSATGFRSTSNFGIFMNSLGDTPFPMNRLNGQPISILNGLKVHVVRREVAGRKDMPGKEEKKEGDRKPTVLIISKLISLPWENKKAATTKAEKAGGAAAAAAGAPAQAAAVELDEEQILATLTMVSDLITAKGGTATLRDIGMAAVTKLKFPADAKTAAGKLVKKPEWLAEYGFVVDGDNVTVAA
jgi:hypothetical protein